MDSDSEREMAAQILQASKETTRSIAQLAEAVERKDRVLQADIRALREIVVGKQGDNGLSMRVRMLEERQHTVDWKTVVTVVTLLLTAAGLYIALGGR